MTESVPYPATRTVDATDTLHGETVPDPYRWLEEGDAPETRAWTEAQNTLTERYLQAIRHPLVNVITHPANRTPARFEGYDLNFDALFAAAAETGTAMEVDGAPGHLDLDGTLARRAVEAGVTLVIDSDCHRSDGLARQMAFGVGTARRGWIEPAHVLNTRGIDEVRAFVARKRARS